MRNIFVFLAELPKIGRACTPTAARANALVRLVPSWYADLGPISLYFATRTLLPAKTRVFVDFVLEAFRRDRLAERFAGSLG
jgi:DNA-binding transcriptional LysR family regulator